MDMEPTNTENQETQHPAAAENASPQEENTRTTEKPQAKPLPQYDLNALEAEAFPATLQALTQHPDWTRLGREIRALADRFEQVFSQVINEKKKAFIAEGGNEIDFSYSPEYKRLFSQEYRIYKQKKAKHFKEREAAQKVNLERRKEIIEKIKSLIEGSESPNTVYDQFKQLQDSWHSTGPVPREESNNLWQTYKFHVERFYDFLHLNRELRDLDYKHNYEEKRKLIEKAEALTTHPDVVLAIRELNTLHRLWKNDLGPVAKEHREDLWSRFQAATKIIHERKNEYNKNLDQILADNLAAKYSLIEAIKTLTDPLPTSHNAWQNALKKQNELKEKFYTLGRVPKGENKALWTAFRENCRAFNHEKNIFYKTQKQNEREFVAQKRALIDEVNGILNDPQWREHLNRMKQVQADWKKTGRISRKLSNKLWEEFRTATNTYFDRLKNKATAFSPEDQAIIKAKQAYLDEIKKEEAPKDTEELYAYIGAFAEHWEAMGAPSGGPLKNLQAEVLKYIHALWENTDLKGKEKAEALFKSRMLLIKTDKAELDKEHIELNKKVEEANNERIQLQNNLAFFSDTSTDNPLVKDVTTKIDRLSEQIDQWTDKINALKSMKRGLKKQAEESTPAEENSEENETV